MPLTVIARHRLRQAAAFDLFWHFLCERQSIYFRRLAGRDEPWTADPILRHYRFTNVYRAADRVTQFLIAHVIRRSDPNPEDLVFRILLYKLFNKIETWQLLERRLGSIHHREFSIGHYRSILDEARARGRKLYSPAYIIPMPALGEGNKHRNHLKLLELVLTTGLPAKLAEAKSLEAAYHLLRQYPSIGPFLAFQFAIDLNYSELLSFSEMEFVVAGPGAVRGIHKCFPEMDGHDDAYVIRATLERANEELTRRGLKFWSLWGRDLQLVDCQNVFCEVDKYLRVALPGIGSSHWPTRIKRLYRPNADPLGYSFPAKWQLNPDPAYAKVVAGAAPPP